jgi:hypothetical protein
VSSAGFWPGGGAIDYPAFYSYAYLIPEAFAAAPVRREAAFFHQAIGEFILPLQTTYEAAANAAGWDRAALEMPRAEPGFRGQSREAARSRH